MQVIRDPMRSTDLPRGGVGTIGNFDGVHLGHRRILEGVVTRARETGRPSFAITFEPHPMAVLRPDRAPRRIQTLRQKEEAIEALGIDALLVIPFTRDFSLIEPRSSCGSSSPSACAPAEMHVGAHFAFGRGKRGDLALLARLGAECGFTAQAVEEVFYEGSPVSSTRIRRALERGAVVEANAMLGRAYELDGIVSRGDRLGHRIGVPTINLEPENELAPADGVYVTEIEIRSFDRALRERDEHRPPTDPLRGLHDDDRDVRPELLVRRLWRPRAALLPRAPARGAQVPVGHRAEGADPARHRRLPLLVRRPSRAGS
jgi:riboflavin kinase/FMN adenylyltransferase